jgi:hypothetical protein
MKIQSEQIQVYKLTKENSSVIIGISPDRPVLNLSNFRIRTFNKINLASSNIVQINYKLSNNNESIILPPDTIHINIIPNQCFVFEEINKNLYDDIIISFDKIEISAVLIQNVELDFEITFEYSNVDLRIGLSFDSFKNHINLKSNSRILFSSAFGQGKTTFLNEYFSRNPIEYKVIKLYPVNYSISSNEDIFKYIKCEILFQLMGQDVKFDKEVWSWKTTLPEYLILHPEKIFTSFLKALPSIGKSWFDAMPKVNMLLSALNVLIETREDYKKYDKKQQKEEFNSTKDYICELYEKDGGIYEGNIFTEIIRKLLEQLKGDKNGTSKTVLLIDDLDRMDPEHIFRILNVFSAHFDNHIYEEQGLANKFGFDKIVIVCDLDNVRNIYAHKYGEKCDFAGYINKYYSLSPFSYDNKNAFLDYLEKINYRHPDTSPFPLLKLILSDLTLCNEFSIRQMNSFIKLDKSLLLNGKEAINYSEFNTLNSNLDNGLFYVIHYLFLLYDVDTLKYKLGKCKNMKWEKRRQELYNIYGIKFLFNALVEPNLREAEFKTPRRYDFNNEYCSITFEETRGSSFSFDYHIGVKIDGSNGNKPKINTLWFYNLLVLNVDAFVRMGGLKGMPKV